MLNTSTTLYSLLLTLTAMPCSLPLLYRWWIWGSENVNVFKITQLISSLDRFKPREFDPNVYALILLYLPSSLGHGLNYWFSKVFQEASKPLSILGVGSPFQRRWLSPLLCPPPTPQAHIYQRSFVFTITYIGVLFKLFFFLKKGIPLLRNKSGTKPQAQMVSFSCPFQGIMISWIRRTSSSHSQLTRYLHAIASLRFYLWALGCWLDFLLQPETSQVSRDVGATEP